MALSLLLQMIERRRKIIEISRQNEIALAILGKMLERRRAMKSAVGQGR
jgi:hypothetical protein